MASPTFADDESLLDIKFNLNEMSNDGYKELAIIVSILKYLKLPLSSVSKVLCEFNFEKYMKTQICNEKYFTELIKMDKINIWNLKLLYLASQRLNPSLIKDNINDKLVNILDEEMRKIKIDYNTQTLSFRELKIRLTNMDYMPCELPISIDDLFKFTKELNTF